MARDEEDREDLLREATALVERVELQIYGLLESVVAGFRRDSAASFFFGQDVVYQFNTACELRRGFFEGKLLKAERGRLIQLTRQRTAESVNLVRHELTPLEERSSWGKPGNDSNCCSKFSVGANSASWARCQRTAMWLIACAIGWPACRSRSRWRIRPDYPDCIRSPTGSATTSAKPALETSCMSG